MLPAKGHEDQEKMRGNEVEMATYSTWPWPCWLPTCDLLLFLF